jgi:hypothetical protein
MGYSISASHILDGGNRQRVPSWVERFRSCEHLHGSTWWLIDQGGLKKWTDPASDSTGCLLSHVWAHDFQVLHWGCQSNYVHHSDVPFWTTLNAFVVSFERVPWPVHEDVATSCGWWFPFLFSCNRFRVRGRNMAKPPVTCSLHISMAQNWMNFQMYGLLFHVIRYGNTWKSIVPWG